MGRKKNVTIRARLVATGESVRALQRTGGPPLSCAHLAALPARTSNQYTLRRVLQAADRYVDL
jgi:hypothetical protein